MTRKARAVNAIVLLTVILNILYTVIALPLVSGIAPKLIFDFLLLVPDIGILIVLHRGSVDLAGGLYVNTIWLYVTIVLVFRGGTEKQGRCPGK